MVTIMAEFGQLEGDAMIERTRAGLAAAAANRSRGGRPREVDDAAAARAKGLESKGIGASGIAKSVCRTISGSADRTLLRQRRCCRFQIRNLSKSFVCKNADAPHNVSKLSPYAP